MDWKHTVNAVLTRTTGYQLQRPTSGRLVTLGQAVARLEKVAARLEAQEAPKKPKAAASRPSFPDDFDDEIRDVITAVRPFTMTSPDKLHALITATRYLHERAIPGAVVECGVWRGGSMHAVARTLSSLGEQSRELYLFDTFEGMSAPSERDVRQDGKTAEDLLANSGRDTNVWAEASLEEVRAGFDTVPYPAERLHFVQGKVEETVPDAAPDSIALLRLDTDWYDSTKHELEHLYPRLVSGGVLIIDDYGSWQGAKLATDEFLARTDDRLLMLRAGRGRIAVKP